MSLNELYLLKRLERLVRDEIEQFFRSGRDKCVILICVDQHKRLVLDFRVKLS